MVQVHNPYMKDETFMRKNMNYIRGIPYVECFKYWSSFWL